jgi:hypothetical protein
MNSEDINRNTTQGPGSLTTPNTGTVSSTGAKATPKTQDELRQDLLAHIQKLFGLQCEFIRLTDERIPKILTEAIQRLKFICAGEFVGVPCGGPSNFAAIALSGAQVDLPAYNRFFELNPTLNNTVTTAAGQVTFVWVKLAGGRLPNRALPNMLWLGDGLLPTTVGRTTPDSPLRLDVIGDSVMEIRFEDLKWPLDVHELLLLERIEGQHGKLVQPVGPRKRTLNYRVAATFLAEALNVIYDKNNDSFFMLPPGTTKYGPLSKIQLSNLVSTWLQRQAAKDPASFPTGDHVEKVVKLIKMVSAVERPDEPGVLKRYLIERLERRPGSSLTTKEIFASYSKFCKTTGLAMLPECVFLDKLAKAIRGQFGLTKVHNVMRPHANLGRMTARYGFNGLSFKTNSAAELKDVGEVGERSEGDTNQTSNS